MTTLDAGKPAGVGPQGPRDFVLQRLVSAYGRISSSLGFGGLKPVAKLAGKLGHEGALSVVKLNSDCRFAFPLNDSYWSKNLFRVGLGRRPMTPYEPEIGELLVAVRDIPYVLIDCGANFGYWSVLASSAPFGSHRVVAVEASADSFARLEYNRALNGNRFSALHKAVYSESGRTMNIVGNGHQGMSLRHKFEDKAKLRNSWRVKTVSLDDLWQRLALAPEVPVVVKLDVEGSEIEALSGAQHLIAQGALFIYEDELTEATHRAYRWLEARGDMKIFNIRQGAAPVPVTSEADVTLAKAGGHHNFVAFVEGSSWSDALHALAAAGTHGLKKVAA